MSRRVSVHHFVASTVTRQYGVHTSDLLGVDFWLVVPADCEFPRTVARINLFTRFYIERATPTEFFVEVLWTDHPSGDEESIGRFGPFIVNLRQHQIVQDYAFHVHNLRLEGVGLHRIELQRQVRRGWRKGESVAIAHTHFKVER